jgi:outer membrane receptor for ferrienterochelin and colicin
MRRLIAVGVAALLFFSASAALADVTGSLSGEVLGKGGVPVKGATVRVLLEDRPPQTVETSADGRFNLIAIPFGDHVIEVEASGFTKYRIEAHISSSGTTPLEISLAPEGAAVEEVEVRATKILAHTTASSTSYEISEEEIAKLPLGDDTGLINLLARTMPSFVEGSYGQVFIRSFDTNIQYQIDGVPLPSSLSNMFGDAFKPRNIDHMEVMTGGLPAEYGQRVAAVVNIITKSGYENPGGTIDLNYGTYNSTSPELVYGGSNGSGKFHYFLSANYRRTDRGLDTPQPKAVDDQYHGGTQTIHDGSHGHNEFVRLDWDIGSTDKVSTVLTNAQTFFQVPNYPDSFSPTDAIFQPNFVDPWGNKGAYLYTPATTDDWQRENNIYAMTSWNHTVNASESLKMSVYYKYSGIHFQNDPPNDLASITLVPGSKPSSFYENRHVNTGGLKGDYDFQVNDRHLVKFGAEVAVSKAEGVINLITLARGSTTTLISASDGNPATGVFESVYAQDAFKISKSLILNYGLRFDATQFTFADATPTDSLLQPRIGLTWLKDERTKYHIFYGRLFQPAPLENVRTTYAAVGQGSLVPYDIKPEKDHYFEAGIDRQIGSGMVLKATGYYVMATDMLDNVQVLNTSISQPINWATGTTIGAELSLRGQITPEWSEILNYAYSQSQGDGQSGGFFIGTFESTNSSNEVDTYTDQTQLHTVSASTTYSKNGFWATPQLLFGSGFYTGPDTAQVKLPAHFTVDFSLGYGFQAEQGALKGLKVSGDVINIGNYVYPITVANAFNGSHYAGGRQFYIRLAKDF